MKTKLQRRVLIAFGPKPYQRLVLDNRGKRPAIFGAVEKQHDAYRRPWIARVVDGTMVGMWDCEWKAIRYLARCAADN